MTDAELARDIAIEAGAALLALREAGTHTGTALGDAADRLANRLILDRLAAVRPDDPVLSEESADDPVRLTSRRVWIVDPLDGTREFREGRSDWAVHVALAIDGVATAGAVALPALDAVFDSEKPAPRPPSGAPPRMLVSRSRPPEEAIRLAASLGAKLVPMGSAGAKAMAILRGEGDIYVHSGGQYEWDSCAPVAVAQAHGLHVSRLDGSPMRYNQADVYLPDLVMCRAEIAEQLLEQLDAPVR